VTRAEGVPRAGVVPVVGTSDPRAAMLGAVFRADKAGAPVRAQVLFFFFVLGSGVLRRQGPRRAGGHGRSVAAAQLVSRVPG